MEVTDFGRNDERDRRRVTGVVADALFNSVGEDFIITDENGVRWTWDSELPNGGGPAVVSTSNRARATSTTRKAR